MDILNSPFDVAPMDNPLVYPGKLPNFSYVYHGDAFYRLSVNDSIENARIPELDQITLQDYLREHGAPSLNERRPIAASGSNASPAQLRRKYKGHATIIPVIRGRVYNLDTVYSAHMASYGAFPATMVESKDTIGEIHVCFVTEHELEILDSTEGSHYHRAWMRKDSFPLILESGESIDSYELYASIRGVLSLEGTPIRLAAVKAHHAHFPTHTQASLLDAFLTVWNQDYRHPTFESVSEFLTYLKDNPRFLYEINRWTRDEVSDFNSSLLNVWS